jgi:hypothetical protein
MKAEDLIPGMMLVIKRVNSKEHWSVLIVSICRLRQGTVPNDRGGMCLTPLGIKKFIFSPPYYFIIPERRETPPGVTYRHFRIIELS